MEKEAAGIRFQSKDGEPRMENLMHHVNVQSLYEEHRKQSRKKATGIDGVTKDDYPSPPLAGQAYCIERMGKRQGEQSIILVAFWDLHRTDSKPV